MTYEELQFQNPDIHIKEMDLSDVIGLKGLCFGDNIAIHRDMTTVEKACILAEELGHYHTTVGDILDQNPTANRKQELHARAWGYHRCLQLSDIVRAFKYGCRNRYELAEYLGVIEVILQDGINYYRQKHGPYTKYGDHIRYFEQLGALELISE